MNYVNVKFGEDCRSKLIAGVNLCSDAVQTTYGPHGRSSIILTNSGVQITKDGYHTALHVNDADQYVTMGIKLVQDTCRDTAKTVGDGSSSTGILIRDLVNAFSGCANPVSATRKIKSLSETVIEELNKRKFQASNKEDLEKVATISANNDETIGAIVAEAFNKVGKDGVVTLEESEEVTDTVDYSEGFRIDRGFSSSYFVNTPKGTCELENVYVYISETKVDEIKKIADIADQCIRNKRSLLLMAPNFDSEIIIGLKKNLELLNSCTVITPGHHNMREEWLKDLRALLGESMTCDKVVLTKNYSTFIGCHGNADEIAERVALIRGKLEGGQLAEFDLNTYKKRLANFTSGIATIYVGGYSQVEMKERYDRIEDAVCATQAALTDGILPGGGVPLREIAEEYCSDDSILCANDDITHNFYRVLKNFSSYLDTEDKSSEDMLSLGVIEPYLVEKTVIENAVSTASLILTADVAIVDVINYID